MAARATTTRYKSTGRTDAVATAYGDPVPPARRLFKRWFALGFVSSLVHARHVHVRVSDASRGLAAVASPVLALQQRLAVLVHLDLGDLDLGRVDADVHGVSCVVLSGRTFWGTIAARGQEWSNTAFKTQVDTKTVRNSS